MKRNAVNEARGVVHRMTEWECSQCGCTNFVANNVCRKCTKVNSENDRLILGQDATEADQRLAQAQKRLAAAGRATAAQRRRGSSLPPQAA
eukprot:1821166-Lingulodinium_polyedra.AAC.1